MTHYRAELTPQMLSYAEKFDDRGDIRWLPYLMYFHPAGHSSDVVNTDRIGFRISRSGDERAAVGDHVPEGNVRVLAGSSTVFGIGATNDGATLPSCLWNRSDAGTPWLNMGGRSHNSTQELLLFLLYRHLLPRVDEIVIFSGFNNLGLSTLPEAYHGDHGAFFNCVEYVEKMDELRASHRKPRGFFGLRGGQRGPVASDSRSLDISEQIEYASELTARHLGSWQLLADGLGARLTFVLQPLAGWVRDEPASEEELLFEELDSISNFHEQYGAINDPDVGVAYSDALHERCRESGIRFLDSNPLLRDSLKASDWQFVDRIHFTDAGHDRMAEILTDALDLS